MRGCLVYTKGVDKVLMREGWETGQWSKILIMYNKMNVNDNEFLFYF